MQQQNVTSSPDLTALAVRTPEELRKRVEELGARKDLVSGLIPERSIVLLVGDSGVGKSPLLYQLAICIEAGLPFLGRSTNSGRVLYMDAENGVAQVGETINRISTFLDLPEAPPDFGLWNLNDAGDKLAEIDELVEESEPALVIIDPLNAIFKQIERDNIEATKAYQHLRKLQSQYGCSFLCVHHLRKKDRSQEYSDSLEDTDFHNWFDQARGPRALVNGSDVRLGVERRPAMDQDQIVIRGFERVRGEIASIVLERACDEDGEAVGYVLGRVASKLKSPDRDALDALPNEFRFKDAKDAYRKGDEATKGFLRRCIAAGVLEQPVPRGAYRKIEEPPPPQAEQAELGPGEGANGSFQ